MNPPKPGATAELGELEIRPVTSLLLVDSVATAGPAASDAGGLELRMGRRYLLGQGVTEDHAEAAQWLWKSVAKRNRDAALLLADLFARGDGAPKSCEEARILLSVAATHSGNTGFRQFGPSSQFTSCDLK